MNVNHALIGGHKTIEEAVAAGTLDADAAMSQYLAETDVDRKATLGVTIELIAETFYGFTLVEAGSMEALIDAIKSKDQELQFH